MTLSIKGHKGMQLNKNNVNVVVTDSQIIYQELVRGFLGYSDEIKHITDEFEEVDLEEQYDFLGDPLLSRNTSSKYMTKIINAVNQEVFPQDRDRILKIYCELVNKVQDVLMMQDVVFELNPDYDFKKLLKFLGFTIENEIWTNPYDIIETVLQIHQLCDLKTTVVFNNVSNYLDNDQMHELIRLAHQMNIPLLLIEFKGDRYFFEEQKCGCFYIDNDLVDWN